MMGANDNMIVCTKKIHFPLVDVGLNLQIPLVISGVIVDPTDVAHPKKERERERVITY